MAKNLGHWFKCKGCGQPIGFFPEGLPPHLPPGTVGHSKPINKIGIPNSVPCELYNRLNAKELADLHIDAEPLEPPAELNLVWPVH